MIKVEIADGYGGSGKAKVNSRGQLVTAPLNYSTFYNNTAAVVDTGYNLIVPLMGMRFVITSIILYADRSVGVNDATVVLYEASSATSAIVVTTLFAQDVPSKSTIVAPSLNVITSKGVWINFKTNDNNVSANLAGYYIDV